MCLFDFLRKRYAKFVDLTVILYSVAQVGLGMNEVMFRTAVYYLL